MNSFQEKRIIELNYEIKPEMQTFNAEWHKKVTFESLGKIDNVGRRTTQIHIGSHSGTHIDAPSHFNLHGKTISEYSAGRFIGSCSFIDLSDSKPFQIINKSRLIRAVGNRDLFTRIILYFDWSKYYGSTEFFNNQPYLDISAAEYLIDKGVKLLGYDLPMPDNPKNGKDSECDSPIHKIFLSNDVLLLEYMNIPSVLPDEITLIALPLRFYLLDGSPVRCIGMY